MSKREIRCWAIINLPSGHLHSGHRTKRFAEDELREFLAMKLEEADWGKWTLVKATLTWEEQ